MNTELEETTETIEYTSDVLTDDGETITPTRSPVKGDRFDRPLSRILMFVAVVVGFVVGIIVVFSMVFGVTQRHEITSTTYYPSGVCKDVHSFMVSGMENGEHPDIFAKYQAAHLDETPMDIGCSIPFESNTNH